MPVADFDKFTVGLVAGALALGFLLGNRFADSRAGEDQVSGLRDIANEMAQIEQLAEDSYGGDLYDAFRTLRELYDYSNLLPDEYEDAVSALSRYHEDMSDLQEQIDQLAQDIESRLENE